MGTTRAVRRTGSTSAILNFWEDPPVQPTGVFKVNRDIRVVGWLAYMLATTYHKTAYRMQPITEYGSKSYFDRNEGRAEGAHQYLPRRLSFARQYTES